MKTSRTTSLLVVKILASMHSGAIHLMGTGSLPVSMWGGGREMR